MSELEAYQFEELKSTVKALLVVLWLAECYCPGKIVWSIIFYFKKVGD